MLVNQILRNQETNLWLHSLFALLVTAFCINQTKQVSAFHLSFGHRILRSASPLIPGQSNPNPQLNPASTLIRPIECKNVNNQSEAGICMFSIDCMQNKGVPLSICKHNYFVGTCCKLPDYNNFVGIVYDLRDTETNQILEARRVAASSSSSLLQSQTISYDVPTNSSSPSSLGLGLPMMSQSTPTVSMAAAASSSSTQPPVSMQPSSQRPGDKYVISSTSLFPTNAPATSRKPAVLFQTTLEQQQQPVATPQGESIVEQPVKSTDNYQGHTLLDAAEMDNFQIQSMPTISNKSNEAQDKLPKIQPQAANLYEIIKDDNSEVLSTLSSAHSLTGEGRVNEQKGQLSSTIVLANNHHQPVDSRNQSLIVKTPLVPVQQQQAQQLQPLQQQQQTQQQATSAGDQEFALTSVQAPESSVHVSTSIASTTTTSTTTTQAPATTPAATTTTTTVASPVKKESQPPVESSPATLAFQSSTPVSPAASSVSSQFSTPVFVDLVSTSIATSPPSTSTTVQTTTPFTTSLSTALLPNVSSHPWAPTQTPAMQHPSASSSSSSSSSVSNSAPLLYSSTTYRISQTTAGPSISSASDQPVGMATSEQPALVGYSQLYSNHHSSPSSSNSGVHNDDSGHSHGSNSMSNHHHNPSRPNLIISSPGLHAASKIVTGSSSGNNLIPGFGGLQSAILSHIPFKLASGLSSGLSSYLQAAMRPAGGKPLISSNTAPSLMHQQHMMANSNSSSSSQNRHSTNAPSSSTTTSITTSSGSFKFPSSTLTTEQSSSAATSTSKAPEKSDPLGARDAIREAQLICGRAQVAQPVTISSLIGNERKRMARIVGGNQSLFGQWPWMVSLRQWRKGAFLHKCGAALLNENWAITAAHCVEKVKAPDLLLRLGEFDVSNQDEPYPYIERRVKTVVSHPSFDPKTFEYDLALLKFAEPVKFERNIVPVCVPSGNDSYVDRMATVIGWGRLYEDGPLPDIIQHVDVPIITNNECERMYKSAGYIEEIPEMFICAGINKGGRDSCEGDSGGPLTMVDTDGRSYLVGIISWGIGCALPSQPGVYTRITAFSGWINQIIDYS